MPQPALPKIQHLLAECRSGYTLPQEFYTDGDVFKFDLQAIFQRCWLQAALEIEIPNVGDYLTLTVGRSPIVIVRSANGGINAFFNTCRHRGAQICQEERGHVTGFVCPYHQWSYDLRGKLLGARLMPKGFDKAAHGLRPVRAETVGGVIYVCLSEEPPDFGPLRAVLAPLLVTMERPAPDSQSAGYASDRERTAAQSRIRMGAGDEERTICWVGCPCGDDCRGGSGSGR